MFDATHLQNVQQTEIDKVAEIPSSNSQRTKDLAAMLMLLRPNSFGISRLDIVWDLEFGAWNFQSGLLFRNGTLAPVAVHGHAATFGFAREP
jgi:hypothetical protein